MHDYVGIECVYYVGIECKHCSCIHILFGGKRVYILFLRAPGPMVGIHAFTTATLLHACYGTNKPTNTLNVPLLQLSFRLLCLSMDHSIHVCIV